MQAMKLTKVQSGLKMALSYRLPNTLDNILLLGFIVINPTKSMMDNCGDLLEVVSVVCARQITL
jgi:hypothetical protein